MSLSNILFVLAMITALTIIFGGLTWWAATLWIFRCSLKAGAIVRTAPRDDAPIYYMCEGEENYLRYKLIETHRHPGWFALKKGGYVSIDDVKSIAAIEYEEKITTT